MVSINAFCLIVLLAVGNWVKPIHWLILRITELMLTICVNVFFLLLVWCTTVAIVHSNVSFVLKSSICLMSTVSLSHLIALIIILTEMLMFYELGLMIEALSWQATTITV